MLTNLSAQYVSEYLEEATGQARQLIQLLDDERKVIAANDGQALEGITASKEKLAQAMQASTQVCSQRLQQAGFSANNSGLLDYFQSCNEVHATQLTQTWENLQSLLKECKDENRINGKLLGGSQRRIKQALAILQGKPVDEELYGRGGESVNHSTGNSLTHA